MSKCSSQQQGLAGSLLRMPKIMAKKWIIVAFVLVSIIFGFSLRSIADCKSDCQDEYKSEVDSCKTLSDDPDEPDALETCLDEAQSQYESCIEQCED
jgi:hypothetical protein